MIRCGGASRKGQFGQCGLSRNKKIVGLDARPNGIQGLEPVEEIGVLRGRDGAGEGLIEVMMRVDEARQYDVALKVEDFVGSFWQLIKWTHTFNKAVANKKTPFGDFALMVVHGDNIGGLNEECGHSS